MSSFIRNFFSWSNFCLNWASKANQLDPINHSRDGAAFSLIFMEIFHRGLVFPFRISNWCCDCTNCKPLFLVMLIDLMAAHTWCVMLATFSPRWLFCSKNLMSHDLNSVPIQIHHWTCRCHSSQTSFRQSHRQRTQKTSESRFLVTLTRRQATVVRVIWWTRQSLHHRNSERHEAREIFCRVKFVARHSIDRVYSNVTWEHILVSFTLINFRSRDYWWLWSWKSSQDECRGFAYFLRRSCALSLKWLIKHFLFIFLRWKASCLRCLWKRLQHVELVKHSSTYPFRRETSR